MEKLFSLPFSVIIYVAFICICFASSGLAQNVPDSEEYFVYESLLEQKFIKKETKELVIKNQTEFQDSRYKSISEDLIRFLPSLTKETIESFNSRNKNSAQLKDKFKLNIKINLIDKEVDQILYGEISRQKPEGEWEAFRKKYPTADAIIIFSRVGFNKDKSQSLVFVADWCGKLCGEGNYILLTKEKNIWKIKESFMSWIS